MRWRTRGQGMARRREQRGDSQAIHVEVLAAARRICSPLDWSFRLIDVVRDLPHLREASVRTHIVSRCCVNAPVNHPHRWPYFRRVGRGRYQIQPLFRPSELEEPLSLQETADGDWRHGPATDARPAIHAVISESEGWYVAECLEVAVVTQGRSLDETLVNLRRALTLHLDDEELARTGLPPAPRLVVNYETSAFSA